MDRSAKYLKSLVGAPRFELGASCAQGRRATRLRYAPTVRALIIGHFSGFWLLESPSGERPRSFTDHAGRTANSRTSLLPSEVISCAPKPIPIFLRKVVGGSPPAKIHT